MSHKLERQRLLQDTDEGFLLLKLIWRRPKEISVLQGNSKNERTVRKTNLTLCNRNIYFFLGGGIYLSTHPSLLYVMLMCLLVACLEIMKQTHLRHVWIHKINTLTPRNWKMPLFTFIWIIWGFWNSKFQHTLAFMDKNYFACWIRVKACVL